MGGQLSSAQRHEFPGGPLSVYIATWNLGNHPPPAVLTPWLPGPEKSYDLIAVGVQESTYPPHDPREGDNEAEWFRAVYATLGPERYVVVAEQSLSPRTDNTFRSADVFKIAVSEGRAKPSGIRLSVYARRDLAHCISDIEVTFKPCGRLGGLSGNKGGVGVSLRLGGTRVMFVNAHLNAHLAELDKRNEDYHTVAGGLAVVCRLSAVPALLLADPTVSYEARREARRRAVALSGPPSLCMAARASVAEALTQSDVVFFFGDLNYRLAPPLPTEAAMTEHVLAAIAARDWAGLAVHDQLAAARRSGTACAGFCEAPLAFPPTFKFVRGQHRAAEPHARYHAERCPSYCDRIQWRASWRPADTAAAAAAAVAAAAVVADAVHAVAYRSLEGAFDHDSDHMPVVGAYTVAALALPARPWALLPGCCILIKDLVWEPHPSYSVAPADRAAASLVVSMAHILCGSNDGDGDGDPLAVAETEVAAATAPVAWVDGDDVTVSWPAGTALTLSTAQRTLRDCAAAPVVLFLRNTAVDDQAPGQRALGEAPLHLAGVEPGMQTPFALPLYQAGFPFGTLRGTVLADHYVTV